MILSLEQLVLWFRMNISDDYHVCDTYNHSSRNGWNFILSDNCFIHYENGGMHNLFGPAIYTRYNVQYGIRGFGYTKEKWLNHPLVVKNMIKTIEEL